MNKTPESLVPQDYKSHLNPEQLKAAEAMGTVCVIAGAGTGKTSTLTAAIIDKMRTHNIQPSRIFATTFTKKAAEEMSIRLRHYGAPVPKFLGTFHSNARKLMGIYPALAGGIDTTQLDILDPDMANTFVTSNVLNHLSDRDLEEAQELARGGDFRPDGVSLAALATKFLDIVSVMKMDSLTMENIRENDVIFSRIFNTKSLANPAGLFLAKMYFDKYTRLLKQHNAMDFDDLISIPTLAMRENPDLQDKVSNLFDAVFIDEDQDTNTIQEEFASYITKSSKVVFRVGDDGQSIYGWRGSKVSILRDFKQKAETTVVLHRNYRSTQNILDFAADILAFDKESDDKELTASNTKITSKEANPITTIDFGPDGRIWDEAEGIAGIIAERLAKGASPSSFAIISRTNANALVCYHNLINRNIPAICEADDIFRMKIVRFLIAYAVAAAYPDDSVNALRLDDLFSNPYMPNMKMGQKTRDKLGALIVKNGGIRQAVAEFRETTTLRYRKKADEALDTLVDFINKVQKTIKQEGDISAESVFHGALTQSGLSKELAVRRDTLTKSLEKLKKSAFPNRKEEDRLSKEYEAVENAQEHISNLLNLVKGVGVREAIEMIMLAKDTKKDDGKPRVRVTTIHKAKGLEWDTVFIPSATESSFFYRCDTGSPEYYEAVRCAYVAFTRPRHELIMTYGNGGLLELASYSLHSLPHNDLVCKYGAIVRREDQFSDDSHEHDEYEEDEGDYL